MHALGKAGMININVIEVKDGQGDQLPVESVVTRP